MPSLFRECAVQLHELFGERLFGVLVGSAAARCLSGSAG